MQPEYETANAVRNTARPLAEHRRKVADEIAKLTESGPSLLALGGTAISSVKTSHSPSGWQEKIAKPF